MKQTAIQELIVDLDKIKKRLSKKDEVLTIQLIINSAKAKLEMEKEQIIDAYRADLFPCSDEDAEQYYNETYGRQTEN